MALVSYTLGVCNGALRRSAAFVIVLMGVPPGLVPVSIWETACAFAHTRLRGTNARLTWVVRRSLKKNFSETTTHAARYGDARVCVSGGASYHAVSSSSMRLPSSRQLAAI